LSEGKNLGLFEQHQQKKFIHFLLFSERKRSSFLNFFFSTYLRHTSETQVLYRKNRRF